jgi:tetrapyrrole methylase family protein/MazG family protein
LSEQLDRFIAIMTRLRGPQGCPWDRKQTHQSLVACLLDEAYEFFEAVAENDNHKMRDELGDLLLQIGLHSQIASERGDFTIDDVATAINEKLIRRHPHVFGSEVANTAEEVLVNWERIKRTEKEALERPSAIDGIPAALPALFKAEKIQRKAATVGFDWPEITPVLDKVEEEFAEFREALEQGDMQHATGELGDILFALVNVGRHKGICAEEALRQTIDKFGRRFRFIEERFATQGKPIDKASLAEMDLVWEESKKIVG